MQPTALDPMTVLHSSNTPLHQSPSSYIHPILLYTSHRQNSLCLQNTTTAQIWRLENLHGSKLFENLVLRTRSVRTDSKDCETNALFSLMEPSPRTITPAPAKSQDITNSPPTERTLALRSHSTPRVRLVHR